MCVGTETHSNLARLAPSSQCPKPDLTWHSGPPVRFLTAYLTIKTRLERMQSRRFFWFGAVELDIINSTRYDGVVLRPPLIYGHQGALSSVWFHRFTEARAKKFPEVV